MYSGLIAPWENHPKYLRFSEIIDPLELLNQFFAISSLEEHTKKLRLWRDHVVNKEHYKDSNGPGHLLFIHDFNVKLIEALHLMLLKSRDTWNRARSEVVSMEQIEKEKQDWIYFPDNLTDRELIDPYKMLKKCFKKISPQKYRDYLHEWLFYALSNFPVDGDLITTGEIVEVYENLITLYSVAWLIRQRESKHAETKAKVEVKQSFKATATLTGIDTTLSEGEKFSLSSLIELIVKLVPTVRMIYLMGTKQCPVSFYLLILVDDTEKTPEHELANKIEDKAKAAVAVVPLLHKLSTAQAGIHQGRRFWNDVLSKMPSVYVGSLKAPLLPQPTGKILYRQRAEMSWERWGDQGKGFLNGAVHYINEGNYALALFLLHQAAESSLIGIIRAVIGYRITAHNLYKLVRLTLLFTDDIQNALQLTVPENIRLFGLLTSAYSDARYKSSFKTDEQSARAVLVMVDQLWGRTEAVFQRFIASLSVDVTTTPLNGGTVVKE
jgi:HEPN domain-containing protein